MEEEKKTIEEAVDETATSPETDVTEADQIHVEKKFCVQCGAEISEDQLFCSKCGHKVGEKLSQKTEKIKTKNRKNVVIGAVSGIILIAAIVVAVLLIRGTQAKSVTLNKDSITVKVGETASLSFTIDPDNTKDKTVTWSTSNESIAKVSNGTISGINEGDCTVTVKTKNAKVDTCEIVVLPAGPDLQALYNDYCTSTFATLASDGSYLYVDTNPTDTEDYTDYDAYLAIGEINEVLELPESVFNRMGQTRSMDGIQSYSTDDLEITWTYHPDHGLEVNYTLK